MKTDKTLLIVIILIVIAILAFFFYDTDEVQTVPEKTGAVVEETDIPSVDTDEEMDITTVEYTAEGFSPKTVSIHVGETVRFINNNSKGMWVASALHPTHQALPEFDQREQTDAGSVYEFTFTEVGSWKYHNHVQASHTGSITVTAG